MPAKKPVTVLDRCFPRQLDALNFFSSMLAKYRLGDVVGGDDDLLLRELLLRHANYDEKKGSGIEAIVAMLSPEGSPCFGVRRTDGSEVEFSFRRCITQIWR